MRGTSKLKIQMGFNKRSGQLSGKGPENQTGGHVMDKGMQAARSTCWNTGGPGPRRGGQAGDPHCAPVSGEDMTAPWVRTEGKGGAISTEKGNQGKYLESRKAN